MEALGEFLKKGREKAGVTLDELAQRTRIRLENLESLEKEDLDNLPSDAYVRGFVRQVCREIGLSPNEGLVRYEMLRAQSGPPDEMVWAEERVDETPGRLERALEDPERVVRIARQSYQWAGIAVVTTAVILVMTLGLRVIRSSTDRPEVASVSGEKRDASSDVATKKPSDAEVVQTPVPRPEPARASPPEPPATKPAPAPARPVEANLSDSGALALPPDQIPFPIRNPALARPAPTPPATATTTPKTTSTPTREVRSQSTVPSTGVKLLLDVHAVRAVEVTVLLDGAGQPRRASLAAGERRQWKAARFFEVTASDGGAVRLSLDGRDLGLAGENGSIAVRTIKRGSTR